MTDSVAIPGIYYKRRFVIRHLLEQRSYQLANKFNNVFSRFDVEPDHD